MNDIPWVEKYRPTNINSIILDDYNKKFINNIIKNKTYPNLLLYGPPGTGKTTTIINLIKEIHREEINKSLILHLNASDERGIDTIRNQIHKFISSKPLFSNSFKFVVLDEVDYMTKSAQIALKYVLQQYTTNNVIFYLMCNYISKIDETLKNEFIELKFNVLPKNLIIDFLKTIKIKENINISINDIEKIQEFFSSDIRSMINYIQLNFDIKDLSINVINKNILQEIDDYFLISNYNYSLIKKFIIETSIKFNINERNLLIIYLKYLILEIKIPYNDNLFNMFECYVHDNDINMYSIMYIINEIIRYKK
jgi:replication factor C subunit 3/5